MSDEKPEVKQKESHELSMEEVIAVGIAALIEEIGMVRENQARRANEMANAYDEFPAATATYFRQILEERGIL